jgi:hypothetical protein
VIFLLQVNLGSTAAAEQRAPGPVVAESLQTAGVKQRPRKIRAGGRNANAPKKMKQLSTNAEAAFKMGSIGAALQQGIEGRARKREAAVQNPAARNWLCQLSAAPRLKPERETEPL